MRHEREKVRSIVPSSTIDVDPIVRVGFTGTGIVLPHDVLGRVQIGDVVDIQYSTKANIPDNVIMRVSKGSDQLKHTPHKVLYHRFKSST